MFGHTKEKETHHTMAKPDTKTADAKTLELIETVKREKQAIAEIERPQFHTNMSFSYVENDRNAAINLHVESNLKTLINIAAFLFHKEKDYEEAAQLLGVVDPPRFIWCGFPVDEWIADIELRIKKLQIGARRKKLQELEDLLESVISPELRRQMILDSVAAQLG